MACMIGNAYPNQDSRPASQYRELAPPPVLVTHLLCTWTQCIRRSTMLLHRTAWRGRYSRTR